VYSSLHLEQMVRHETLRNNPSRVAVKKEGLNTKVHQTQDRTGRVVGVERS